MTSHANCLDDYVEIPRYVREIDENGALSNATRALVRRYSPDRAKTLSNLLDTDCPDPLVLIAPSGTGKTMELRHQARRLREQGRAAVFAEALGVVARDHMDLDPDEDVALLGALGSRERAILIIDGVDELNLHQRTMEELFRHLCRRVDFVAHPLRLVFSARNGAWNAETARELQRQLKRFGECAPKLITFEPLDEVAIECLAKACGVSDSHQFMTEFKREEIDELLDLRPADVRLFVELTRQTGSFLNWTRVLNDYIKSSLVEERLTRSQRRTLPPREAQIGLARVAAAATLMKLPHVCTPTTLLAEGAISSTRLFSDWPTGKVTELFENPLFVHKGRQAEAVQLPQGRISDFLAALWFAGRARNGMSPEEIRGHLLVRVPWSDEFDIPQAHRAVVGWLASEVPEFRKLIVGRHPEIILYEGDPDRLSDSEIVGGLRNLCEASSPMPWDGQATSGTVRRVARPNLEREVVALAMLYEASPSVLSHLLRWIELGRYSSCADWLISLAQTATNPVLRFLAIRAVSAASPDRRHELLCLLDDDNEHVRAALLRALVPEHLSGKALTDFLCTAGGHSVRYELAEISDSLSTVDLDASISAVLPNLSNAAVASKRRSAFDVVLPLAISRLARIGDVPIVALEALGAIERMQHGHCDVVLTESDVRQLDHLLSGNADLRHGLWLLRLRAAEGDSTALRVLSCPLFGHAQGNDIEWLWRTASALVDRRLAETVLESVWRRLPPAERDQLLRGGIPEEAAECLRGWSDDDLRSTEMRAADEAKKRAKAEEQRAENIRLLSDGLAKIESGEDVDAIHWAWQHLVGQSQDLTQISAERLRECVGEDLVQTFLRGLRMYWRKADAYLRIPGEDTPTSTRIALTGLSLDARSELDFSSLAVDDAERAATLALHNLNSFPFWFGDLARRHMKTVRKVLEEQVALEWKYDSETHGVLRFAPYSEREVASCIREIVLQVLEDHVPAHAVTLSYAVDVLLTSDLERSRLLALVRREIVQPSGELPHAQWLRLWSHIEPEAAAGWTEKLAKSKVHHSSFMAWFLEAASMLEQDLNEHYGLAVSTSLKAPGSLGKWCSLLLTIVKRSEDVRHQGVYSPTHRDDAQELRNQLLNALASSPTAEARSILLRMRNDPKLGHEQQNINLLLAHQHQIAVEHLTPTWTEDDILRIERSDEKLPRTLAELFALVQSHLQHVGRLISNADFSYRGLFSKKTKEREIQLWVASCLNERARGLYSVIRENVVDDDKEVDISAFAPGVGQIPIEIKPLGPYSVAKLEGVMRNQLLGQYMLPPDRRCGILLLVRRDKTTWDMDGKKLHLRAVTARLQKRADRLGVRFGKEIKVAVIDLLGSPSEPPRKTSGARFRSLQRPKVSPERVQPRKEVSKARTQRAKQS